MAKNRANSISMHNMSTTDDICVKERTNNMFYNGFLIADEMSKKGVNNKILNDQSAASGKYQTNTIF